MKPKDGQRKTEAYDPWIMLREDFVCACGRPLRKKGMMRELRAGKNYRPGPTVRWIRSGICTVRLDCFACGRSWDARFLVCDRYDAKSTRPVPKDAHGLRPGEDPETRLREIVARRARENKKSAQTAPASAPWRLSTEADGALARRKIAEIRAAMGWE